MVPVLILVLVILIAIAWGVPHEQRELRQEVLEELSAADVNIDNINIHFEGRDAYIEGENVSLEEVRQLSEKIEGISGVRTVSYKAVNYTVGTTSPAVVPTAVADGSKAVINAEPSSDNTPVATQEVVISEATAEESDTGLVSKAVGMFSKVGDLVKGTPEESTHEVPGEASTVVETQVETQVETPIVTQEVAVSEAHAAVDSTDAGADTGLVSKAVGMLTKMGGLVKDKVAGDNAESEIIAPAAEPTTSNIISAGVNQAQLDQPLLSGSMLFRPAVMQWPPRMHQSLMEFAVYLKQHPDLDIEIGGFSGPIGNPDYAMQLSEERAQQVKVYLVYQGVSVEQLSVKGYGFDAEKMGQFPVPSSIRFYIKGE